MIITLVDALYILKPASMWSWTSEGTPKYEELIWKDAEQSKPTEEELNAELIRLQAEYDTQDYARKRKAAYPNIYDYMDGIVKDDQTQINKYIADSQAVKVRYPKG
tara:strand:- start:42 stop:359 length:318 start_codon:yes stop_codon:yes gene_type:complete